jgi:hypothetical protein
MPIKETRGLRYCPRHMLWYVKITLTPIDLKPLLQQTTQLKWRTVSATLERLKRWQAHYDSGTKIAI